MKLVLINSFGPMGSSVIASIIEKFGFINLPIRKRQLNEYVLGEKVISNNYFQNRTIDIIKRLSEPYQVGGISVLDRNTRAHQKRLDIDKVDHEIKIFKTKKYKNIKDMYFSSMLLANSATIYKNKIIDPVGAIELTTNIQKYDLDTLYQKYKINFDDVKVINIDRNFDGWLNSLCSQLFSKKISLQFLKFNIYNYRRSFLVYKNNINKFNGLNINFENIFIPNTKNIIREICAFLNIKNDIVIDFEKEEFDCYGSLSNFNKTFKLHDDDINFLSNFSKKFARYYIQSKKNIFKDSICVIFFQCLYIIDYVNYKIRFKSND